MIFAYRDSDEREFSRISHKVDKIDEWAQLLNPQSVEMRTLMTLVEQRRRLMNDRIRITNRLSNALKQYYPQALDWFDHIDTPLFCGFIKQWPTLLRSNWREDQRWKSSFMITICIANRSWKNGSKRSGLRNRLLVAFGEQRAKGCTYQAAVRALAFKWTRILYRCWITRTPYD